MPGLARGSAERAEEGSRVPAQGRRFHRGPDRDLDRIQTQEGVRRDPPAAASVRIRAVLRHLDLPSSANRLHHIEGTRQRRVPRNVTRRDVLDPKFIGSPTAPRKGTHTMTTPKNVMKMIKDSDVKYVDFRFTDPRGKWQHLAHHVTTIDEEFPDRRRHVRRLVDRRLEGDQRERHGADAGSSTAVHRSVLRRRRRSSLLRQLEPGTGQPYGRDPRSIAKKAEAYLKSLRHRRHRAISVPKPNFSCSTTCAIKVGHATPSIEVDSEECRPIPTRITKAAIWATAGGQGRLFPGAAGGHRAGHARRDAGGDGRAWASRSKSTTTKSPRRSMNSA